MFTYFIEVAYLGYRYSGFQKQSNAPSIQSEVEAAMSTLLHLPIALTGSSRTDAGVHANQNFFHTNLPIQITQKHLYNLNAILPFDITVKQFYKVPAGSHSRFQAISRRYTYSIYTQKNPFMYLRGWYYPYPISQTFLQEAAHYIEKQQYFESFAKRNSQVNNFNCQIIQAKWQFSATEYVYQVEANRFLRGMVRGMVATMLHLAKTNPSIKALEDILNAGNCTHARFNSPGYGLYLQEVKYPPQLLQAII
jgi:tRNA pseudouridine38-40 synthase